MKGRLDALLCPALLCSGAVAQNTWLHDRESGASVTPSGISWRVEHPWTPALQPGTDYGYYLNGELWIRVPASAASVRISGVLPATTYSPSPIRNGSMKNVLGPNHTAIGINKCGYDDRVDPSRFDQSLVVGASTQPAVFDVVLAPGDVLVSTVSSSATLSSCPTFRPYPSPLGYCSSSKVKKAAVLTAVATVPPADAFRPAYAGNPATRVGYSPHFTWSQVDRASLKRLAVPVSPNGNLLLASELPSLASLTALFARAWLDHLGLEVNEDEIAPTDHMFGYGEQQVLAVSMAALAVLETDRSDLSPPRTDVEREYLLKGLIQAGIDLYGVVRGDQPYAVNPAALARTRFPGGGAKGGGRLWPILFAGMVLGDAGMQHPPRWIARPMSPSYSGVLAFKEDYQFLRARFEVNRDWQGSKHWWRGNENGNAHQRLQPQGLAPLPLCVPPSPPFSHSCLGLAPATPPSAQQWTMAEVYDEQYRFSSSSAIVGLALAARAMGAFDLLNGDSDLPDDGLLGYVDRYMVPMHVNALRQYRGIIALPGNWFRSQWAMFDDQQFLPSPPNPPGTPNPNWGDYRQAHGTTAGLTSYVDMAYVPAMWRQHRWSCNRPDTLVFPLGFYSGSLVEGSASLRKPVLVCHQAVTDPVMDFEVYDLPPNSLTAVYLGGLAVPSGYAWGGPPNQPLLYVDGPLILANPSFSNQFGYALFELALPPPGYQLNWAIQVATVINDPGNPYDGYKVASNAWRFKW